MREVPGLRVVLAGTDMTAAWRGPKVSTVELDAWTLDDLRAYLSGRGLGGDRIVEQVLAAGGGNLVQTCWIADGLVAGGSAWSGVPGHVADDAVRRRDWVAEHVLGRLSDGTRRAMNAAAVLGTFNRFALVLACIAQTWPRPLTSTERMGTRRGAVGSAAP